MVTEILKQALANLKKPVYRIAYVPSDKNARKPEPPTYLTFQSIYSKPSGYADDDSTTMLHTLGVDIYTETEFTTLLADTLVALKQAGFTISSVETEIYDYDTGYYHVPITITILEE